MARLTITLPGELHGALKQAAARRNRTIGELVVESLELFGIKTEAKAAELVAEARKRSGLAWRDASRRGERHGRWDRESGGIE